MKIISAAECNIGNLRENNEDMTEKSLKKYRINRGLK